MSCFVCQKHSGQVDLPGGILYEDELVSSSHGIIREGDETTYLGTLFVEPKRHVAGMAGLRPAEAQRVGLVASRLCAALEQGEGAEHVYLWVLGHHVDHLHVWLVPRYPGTPKEFWAMNLARWPDAPTGGPAEIAALCDRLRERLASDAELAR